MILSTLRVAGLATIAATTLVGCNKTSISSSADSAETYTEQTSQGGGGQPETSDTPAENAVPVSAALCVATPGSSLGYSGSVAQQITDADDSVFNFSVVEPPKYGSLQLDLSSGDFDYQPTGSSQGYLDTFTYRVDDLNGGTAEGTVEIVYGALRIMPLGDSITFGVTGYTGATGDVPKSEFAVGYRQALYDNLRDSGYMVDFVGGEQAGSSAGLADPDHQGMPGWTSWQVGDAITDWLDSNPADVVLAHVGTNDHKISTDGINYLLNNLNNWGVNNNSLKTLLAQIVDQRPDTFFEDTVEQFNANLAELVNISWPSVDLVDQYSALNNATDLTPLAQDSVGLHPNAGGYQKMAAVWFDALEDSGKLHKCP